ncbi:hypothetical protein MD484_g1468, partial [Candolleomyces efflorescens]
MPYGNEASTPASVGPPISQLEASESPNQLWALVIGINSYSKHPLNGAVADADAIREYLETTLKVPKDRIVHLRDREATRCRIISAFEGLRDNDSIRKGDPILIYYAGHGGKALRPGDDDPAETLIPVDYVAGEVAPIPDRTIAKLINGISNKRGDNITVILDCCHSGSGTRGDETVREFVLDPNDVPAGLDAEILEDTVNQAADECHSVGTRGLQAAKGFGSHGMKSHVLLAACSANEVARESFQVTRSALAGQPTPNDPKEAMRGRFTVALLEMLENTPWNQMTYAEVLNKIRFIKDQHPQCEGFHKTRVLFDAKVGGPTHKAYEVTSQVRYILQAGKDQGITDGAELTLYRDSDEKRQDPLGVMKAQGENIGASTTVLKSIDEGKRPDVVDLGPTIAILEYEVRIEFRYILQAGKDQGIKDGAELMLYRGSDEKRESPLGVVKVQRDDISTSTTNLQPADEDEFPYPSGGPIIAVRMREGIVHAVKSEVRFNLQAGEDHGITDGAQFVLYRDGKREARLAVMKAQEGYINPSTTTLKPVVEGQPPASFCTSAVAVQTREGISEYKVKLKVRYILQAGLVHGVTAGAEFTLYRDKKREVPLAVMKADESNIEDFITVLKPVDKEKLPSVSDNPTIAIQTKAGASEDFLVHFSLGGQYGHIIEAVEKQLSAEDVYTHCRIRRGEESEAALKIATTGEQLSFIALDGRARSYNFTNMQRFIRPSVEELRAILRGAAHYHFHLNLGQQNNKIQNRIAIEFFEVKEARDEDGDPVFIPVGDNMLKGGQVEYEVNDGAKYGMKITNNAPWDLYFCCFFFDHADFSIAPITEVSALSPYRKDITLKKGHSVKIGYDDSSIYPFESDVRKGLKLTIGFLKFYFTSEAIDLSHIPQESPFITKPPEISRGLKEVERRSNPVRGTVLVPLIQRRR